MNKRKLSAIAAAALAAALSLSACGSSGSAETDSESTQTEAAVSETEQEAVTAEAAAPADITGQIMAAVEMSSMAEVTSDRIGNYLEIDTSHVKELSMYICGSGAFADEVGVFLMDSPEAAEEGADVIKKRIETRTADFRDYNPDECGKLESSVVKTSDCWLFYVVSADNEAAEEIFDANT